MYPQLLEMLILAIVGILAGGVVNVLADDLPLSRAPRVPRFPDGSVRPLLAWLGITAFLLNLRRSRRAGTKQPFLERSDHPQNAKASALGWRHPLTELITAALVLVLYVGANPQAGEVAVSDWMWIAYAALYVLIGIVDIEHRRIPIPLLMPLAGLALFDAAFMRETSPNLASALVGGLLGFLIFYLIFAGGFLFVAALKRLGKRPMAANAIGFGDVMLSCVVGLVVGFPNIIVAIYVSIFAGALGAIAVITAHYVTKKSYGGFARIPYGPYILVGAIVAQLLGDQLAALLPGA